MYDDAFAGMVADWSEQVPYEARPETPAPGRRQIPDPAGKLHMLLQDLRTRVLPYGDGTHDGFKVHLVPDNADVARLITNALPVRGYPHSQLARAFRDYIETALWHLTFGSLYLKLVYYRPADQPAAGPVAFRIEVLEPERIHKRFGRYFYWMPRVGPSDDVAVWTKVPLPAGGLVVVSLPRPLRRTVDRAVRVIDATNQDLKVMSDFTFGRFAGKSAFDLGSYNQKIADVVLRETREVGWGGRGLLTEGMLDPYKAWREIQFARFNANLRDLAVGGLQDAINRAGAAIGFDASLQLAGVLTKADLDRLEHDLSAGTRPMREIFAPKIVD
ncbi:hypothetical protein [Microbacterium sp. CH1]|uniref:hypothetical protein n=1 Tax=Microbacterium sp. CH1 TaxID=1770208 RepID=UPI000789077E|nr:hypothetical protein [Microbacterium sp. CH1]KYJ97529.1 hypothetical protein AUV07_14970 [Microbacterium sp. CH1]